MNKIHLSKYQVILEPSIADPVHLIKLVVPVQDTCKSGLTSYTINSWAGIEPTRLMNFTMSFLGWLIKRRLKVYREKGIPIV